MIKVLLTHPGTQYSFRLADQLHRTGLLYKFITGLAFSQNSLWWRWLPGSVKRAMANRVTRLPQSKLHTFPWYEWVSLIRIRFGGNMEDVLFERNKKFQTHLNESLLKKSDVVIGFDTSSWLLSRRCKLLGKTFVLDQSIAHPLGKLKIYEELRVKYPAWKEDIQVKRDEHTLLEQEEYKNADLIVVASAFTKKTLMMGGIPETKIRVNPYGVGQEFFIDRNRDDHHTGCRFLFLGTLGARKGTPFLLDVWRSNEFWKLNSETWLAGPATDEVLGLIDGTPGFSYVGRRPHNAMPDLLRQCDVLVFPSYYEGFGQVILEAMAAGLPVITTDRTAGPDVIIHGEDGMLLRAGSHDDLTQAMLWCIRQPDARKVMGQKAREKAKSFSWDAYGNRWLKILEEVHNFRSF